MIAPLVQFIPPKVDTEILDPDTEYVLPSRVVWIAAPSTVSCTESVIRVVISAAFTDGITKKGSTKSAFLIKLSDWVSIYKYLYGNQTDHN